MQPLTDLGNAYRLADRYHPYLKFVAGLGWVVWNGKFWERSENRALGFVCETIRAIPSEIPESCEPELAEKISKWAFASMSGSHITSALQLARGHDSLWENPERFDQSPWKINTQNGILDLATLEFAVHSPDQYMTSLTNASWAPDSECPKWLKFLEQICNGSADLIATLRQCAGYSLSGLTSERSMFILHGIGRNGKSTFVDVLLHTLGSYACYAPNGTFTSNHNNGGPSNDLAMLRGKRLVIASETEEGQRLSQGLVKQITGDHSMTARFLHQEFFTFKPIGKLWMMTNQKPQIRSGEEAIWDRIKLIPFDVRIKDDEVNPNLYEELLDEKDGVFAWAVEGLIEWRAHGNRVFYAKEVFEATENYRGEQDLVQQFLDDCTEYAPQETVEIGRLYQAYRAWATACGHRPVSKRNLSVHLSAKKLEAGRTAYSRYWIGLRLSFAGSRFQQNDNPQQEF